MRRATFEQGLIGDINVLLMKSNALIFHLFRPYIIIYLFTFIQIENNGSHEPSSIVNENDFNPLTNNFEGTRMNLK